LRLLLDTHIWLWGVFETERLSAGLTRVLSDSRNERWLSPLSILEFYNLVAKRRIAIEKEFGVWVSESIAIAGFHEATLTYQVALEAARFPLPHGDPIDRLLVASARAYELTLVTADRNLIAAGAVDTLANR
jgi:PIN domain nuclease of toxin-antitoxin system